MNPKKEARLRAVAQSSKGRFTFEQLAWLTEGIEDIGQTDQDLINAVSAHQEAQKRMLRGAVASTAKNN